MGPVISQSEIILVLYDAKKYLETVDNLETEIFYTQVALNEIKSHSDNVMKDYLGFIKYVIPVATKMDKLDSDFEAPDFKESLKKYSALPAGFNEDTVLETVKNSTKSGKYYRNIRNKLKEIFNEGSLDGITANDKKVYKILLIGPGGVGKTSLASLETGEFRDNTMTIGYEFFDKDLESYLKE